MLLRIAMVSMALVALRQKTNMKANTYGVVFKCPCLIAAKLLFKANPYCSVSNLYFSEVTALFQKGGIGFQEVV